MRTLLKFSAAAGLALTLAGCATSSSPYCDPCQNPAYAADRTTAAPALAPVDDIQIITVTGYGAPKSTFENLAQRRLMALRASELDAYRKVAEQISGLHIVGDSRVDDFIPNRDRLRSFVNSFVQGAAITRQEFEEDGMAVTTMSLKISRRQMQRLLEEEHRWHAHGAHLPAGTAYHGNTFAPHY